MKHLSLYIAIALILGTGFLSGAAVGHYQASRSSFPEIVAVEDMNPGVTTIKFMSYSGGLLKGVADGRKTRLIYNPDKILELNPGDTFEIPVAEVHLDRFYEAGELPEGALYVASSQGKYYYSVLDSRAFGIIPKNRIYFDSALVAEKSGYSPPK